MHLRILLTTSLAALALPAAAHAGSVEISAGHVVHTAAAGEFNALTVAQSGTTAIVRDANHRLRPLGPGCVTQTVNEVRCQGASRITTKPGDGFDTITVQTGLPVVIEGGSGSANYIHDGKAGLTTTRVDFRGGGGLDRASYEHATAGVVVSKDNVANDGRTLTGSVQTIDRDNIHDDVESLDGSPFNDSLNGSNRTDLFETFTPHAGDDIVNGNAGTDVIHADAARDGADRLAGGPGSDVLSYPRSERVVATLDFGGADDGEAGERDQILGVESVGTGAGDDHLEAPFGSTLGYSLSGGAGIDTLIGAQGADTLRPGEDRDTVLARGGADTLFLRDDTPDHGDCGPGVDTVRADAVEARLVLCEGV